MRNLFHSFVQRLGAGAVAAWVCVASIGTARAENTRLLRFPATHGNQIVFTYAGDLFTVPATGGIARRLTSDEDGYEMFARFSPDGKSIAFTGQYDGNTEVYVMPADGGVPKRLTYTATLSRDDVSDRMGPNNIVMTWRDNETVVYRSRRTQWNPFKGNLTLASIHGGVPTEIPVPRGGWCSFSPDGKQMAYNRVFREFRTWKRYRGGQADEIWIHDFDAKTTTKITDDLAQDIFPMWVGRRIYFVSDRDENRKLNLFVYDLDSKQTRKLTQFTEFDLKFPSLGDKAIVFESGGFIHRFDLATEKTELVPIEVREDFASARGGVKDVSKSVATWDVAPDGARAVFSARGDVFTVPVKHGATRNLTQTPGTHERDVAWSPDGRSIAYISDATGEDELYVRPQDGSGIPTQLTSGSDTYKYGMLWSPDGKRIAWSDKKNRLQFVDVATKQITLVDTGDWEIMEFGWSPDSQWLTYTKPQNRRFPDVLLYSVAGNSRTVVTDGWFDVGNPEFSADGKFLYFTSSRTFNPTYSSTEWNHAYNDMESIYLVTLSKDTPSPFAPKSDEVKPKAEDAKSADKPKDPPDVKASDKPLKTVTDLLSDPQFREVVTQLVKNPDAKPATPSPAPESKPAKSDAADKVAVKVDTEGLQQRIAVLPVPASRYGQLTSVANKLFYVRAGKLWFFDFDAQKETEVGDFGSYRVSADKKKIMVAWDNRFAIADVPGGRLDTKDKELNLGDLKVTLDRRAEWNQIYAECWRQMRDYVYDPNLHGVDWPAMRRRYEPLLAHVQTRQDLTYVIGELISELNLGHAYVGGGDHPNPARVPLGLLGARISRHSSGFYRVDEILPGHNWDKKYRSPLTEIGVNVKVGDFIVALDGKPANQLTDLYAGLVGKADRQVTLRVNGEPKTEGARDQVVIPTGDEQPLYYLKWVLSNIEVVSKATSNRVGYVHVPDMSAAGLNEFTKFYYAQLDRDALIVDCRGNGGGNVSPMIIERLRREPVMWNVARNGKPAADPSGQVLGPKVLLIDQHSASDGDIVGYRFRQHKLGPIIGERSWGGVVGIRGSLPLLDGGFLNRPEFSRYDLQAKEWIMEGRGVDPDIVVQNDPVREYAGGDDQLSRAIEEIKKALAANPVSIPAPPPYPNKSK